MNKEELIEKNAELSHDRDRVILNDQLIRKEFAKAFGWYETNTRYDYGERKLRLPSWEEVFIELGKLLAARNFMDYEGNISELEFKLEDLEKRIKSDIHPNL